MPLTLNQMAFAPPRTKIKPDMASVRTQERLWRRDFFNGAKLRRADL